MLAPSLRRLISSLSPSSGFVEQILFQWLTGKSAKAVTSSAASRSMASIFGSWRGEHASDDVELFANVGGIRFAKLVRMAAATISAERGLEACAKE